MNKCLPICAILLPFAAIGRSSDDDRFRSVLDQTSQTKISALPLAIQQIQEAVGGEVPKGPLGLRAFRRLYEYQWMAGRRDQALITSGRYLGSRNLSDLQRATASYERAMILREVGDLKSAYRILSPLSRSKEKLYLPKSMRLNVDRWTDQLALEVNDTENVDLGNLKQRILTGFKHGGPNSERDALLVWSDIERLYKINPTQCVVLVDKILEDNPHAEYAARMFLWMSTLRYSQMELIPLSRLRSAEKAFSVSSQAFFKEPYYDIIYLIGLSLSKEGKHREAIEPLRKVGYSSGSPRQRSAALRLLAWQFESLGLIAEAQSAAADSAKVSKEGAQLAANVFPEFQEKPSRNEGIWVVVSVVMVGSVGFHLWRRRVRSS